jgi:hypothetical protein
MNFKETVVLAGQDFLVTNDPVEKGGVIFSREFPGKLRF